MPKSQLIELFAHGLGIIEDAKVEFGPGFNVITGETGAGKTLLLGALDLCVGGESTSSRQALLDDMRVAALFRTADGAETVLSREMSAGGRLRGTIDGATTSAEALRNLASELIVIHGQHDSLTLRNRSDVLEIIDTNGRVDTSALDEVRRMHALARTARSRLGGDELQRTRELEFLDFQIAELEDARISSGDELNRALEELRRLSELRDGQAALAAAMSELDGDDESILDRLAAAIGRIPASEAFRAQRDSLHESLQSARESVRELWSLVDTEVLDDGAIDCLDVRIVTLQQVARKYGGSLTVALTTLDSLRQERADLHGAKERLIELDEQIHRLEVEERTLASRVRKDRETAAARLTEAVQRQLPRVALTNAALRFEVDGVDGSSAQILFTPNPGLPEGPLQALASGGELSRVLLALSLETVHEDVVAVFDEIDAGVGGQVAQQIGECLAELGRLQQVLAVTHLASVAAKADHHLVVDKTMVEGSVTTTFRSVSGQERVREIARMLAGDEMSDESLALASRLLETSLK